MQQEYRRRKLLLIRVLILQKHPRKLLMFSAISIGFFSMDNPFFFLFHEKILLVPLRGAHRVNACRAHWQPLRTRSP